MKIPALILCPIFALIVGVSRINAGTMSASSSAPVVNGLDIANFAASNGTEKWWAEANSEAGKVKGQTFTTGSTPVLLKSITYQTSSLAIATKTYKVRVGTVSGTAFSQIHNETFTQNFTWNPGEYMTWVFATPVALSPNTLYGIDIGMTASTSGWPTGIPYIHKTANAYPGGVRYACGSSGVGTDTLTLTTSSDFVFHLDIQHPLNPSPDIGALVPAGDLTLSWTNLSPTTGTDVWVDVWFGTSAGALTKVASAQQNLTSFPVNLPGANTYYWRIDSYLNGAPEGTPVQSTVFSFIVSDSDGDGFPDAYELLHTTPSSATALNLDDDLENGGAGDGLSAWEEYQLGTSPSLADTDGDGLQDGPEMDGVGLRPATNPTKADTDGDGLSDGIESNTGIWGGSANTGTNPMLADTDADGLKDNVETNTGTFVSKTNTGTNPLDSDSDNDNAGDWYEVTASLTNPFSAASKPNVPYPLPDPDASAGVTNKPVKVYIMSGQSNMVGMGKVSGTTDDTLETITIRENKFPDLINSSGGWTTRKDVRYRGVISDTENALLSPGNLGAKFGPELGFGYVMGWYHDEPVLLLKSSIGNRALGWDILPPGGVTYQADGYQFPAFGETPEKWTIGSPTTPWTTGAWYAGYEWDRFFLDESEWIHPHDPVTNVVDVLDGFATQYPSWAAQGFEIAGFVWWQGDRDRYTMGHANRYEQNLVRLINNLRSYYENRYNKDLNGQGQPNILTKTVPNAPFVLATLGQTVLGDNSNPAEKAILDAQLAVDGEAGKYTQYAGNVKTVYFHPLSEGGASNGHYNERAGTYMLAGDSLGRAMVHLLSASSGNTYANWIANFPGAAAMPGFDQDADGDGIDNGAENFFGTNPGVGSVGLVSGAASGNTFTFTHPQNATPAAGVTAQYRWSKDLATFHGHGESDGDGTSVSFNAVTNAGITTVTATVSGTATAKLFVDVKVIQN